MTKGNIPEENQKAYKVIGQMKGPYSYQKTAKSLDAHAKHTHAELSVLRRKQQKQEA